MLDYIIRRVLFIIPTLLGIMFLNFLLVQFVPGGPVEQMIYQFENGSNLDLVGGGGTDAGQQLTFLIVLISSMKVKQVHHFQVYLHQWHAHIYMSLMQQKKILQV